MAKTKIASKGQVTIPKEVRDRLGLRPGDELEFVEEDGVFRLRKLLPTAPFKKYRGYLAGLADRRPDDLVRDMRGNDHGGGHKHPLGHSRPRRAPRRLLRTGPNRRP